MKNILLTAAAVALLAAPLGSAFAQGYDRQDDRRGNSMMMDRHDDHRSNNMMMDRRDDHHDNAMMMRHHDWRRGGRIERTDWDRGARINDWRRYHLSRPPRGYEWRRVDDNYVLAAAAG